MCEGSVVCGTFFALTKPTQENIIKKANGNVSSLMLNVKQVEQCFYGSLDQGFNPNIV